MAMEPLIIYLLKANVVISVLFLFYLLVLRNDKSFWQNRFYLLFSLVFSLFLPLLPAMNFSHLTTITANPLNSLYTTIDHSQMINTHVNTINVAINQGFTPPSIMTILVGIYLSVSLILLLKLIIKLLKLSILIKKTDKQFTGGIYYCVFDGSAPFSFFKYVVINKRLYNDSELQQIILHEKVHIFQWHSVDILIAELAQAILWINPLMIYFKRYIKLNHEYIADDEVINSGIDRKAYQLSILHSSLKLLQAYQLTNLYSSSKIKLRIKMMNLKKSPNANAYKYAFVFLLVVASYFFINPSSAIALQKNVSTTSPAVYTGPLKAFEGMYQVPNQNAFIKLTDVKNVLVVKQLWDGQEFSLNRKSGLEFTKADGGPFKFIKNKDGNVIQLLAFDRDVWIKTNSSGLKEAVLSTKQLKAVEGIYKCEVYQTGYIQVIAKQNKLIAKQLWDGREMPMWAKSDDSFFVQGPNFNFVSFTKNDDGVATKFTAPNNQIWDKVESYQPLSIKLTAQDLKKLEGYYEFKDRKETFLQITANGSGLILKQLWDNREIDFTATSPLAFAAKENPVFTLQFTADNADHVTQVLAFGKDVWNKTNNYHPAVEIKLAAKDLKKFDGKYVARDNKESFIQITPTDIGLVLKQSWDGKQIDFAATGPLDFFSKQQPGFTLRFTSANGGGITQVLAFGTDVWDKVN